MTGVIVEKLLQGQKDEAEELLESTSRDSKGAPSKTFYHGLIHACAEAHNPDAAGWCAMKMFCAGHKPNTVTFNTLIDACAKVGDVGLATKWWHHMKDAGLVPNSITYNTMINACSKAGDAWLAESWMEEMCKDGITPCVISFSTLINAFAKMGKVSKAEGLFHRMVAAGMNADAVIYNSVIDACAKAGHPEKAEYWMSQMQARNLKADHRTFNGLINAAAKVGQVERAERWLREMEKAGCQLDLVTFGSVIHAASRAGDVDRAEYWIEDMAARGLAPNLRIMNTVLHACAHVGDQRGACKWFLRIYEGNLVPNNITYNCMINLYAKAGSLAMTEQWLNAMVAEGTHPDKVTFVTLLRAREASSPRGGTGEPIEETFDAVINAYRSVGNHHGAEQWTLAKTKMGPHILASQHFGRAGADAAWEQVEVPGGQRAVPGRRPRWPSGAKSLSHKLAAAHVNGRGLKHAGARGRAGPAVEAAVQATMDKASACNDKWWHLEAPPRRLAGHENALQRLQSYLPASVGGGLAPAEEQREASEEAAQQAINAAYAANAALTPAQQMEAYCAFIEATRRSPACTLDTWGGFFPAKLAATEATLEGSSRLQDLQLRIDHLSL